MDLIDRSFITNEINNFLSQYNISYNALYVVSLFCGIINSAPTVNCMISVENALPNTDGEYIVYTDHYEIAEYDTELHQFGHTEEYKDEQGYNVVEWYEVCNVTHWMPLPEKPER